MLNGNAGFDQFRARLEHLLSAGLDASDFFAWSKDRADTVLGSLDRLCVSPAVNEFVSTYAQSLADRLWALVSANCGETALEAAPDFIEELGRQTERFAATVPAQTQPTATCQNQSPPSMEASQDYLMAA